MRASGTEPVLRVTVEADDAALVNELIERLSDAVRSAADSLGGWGAAPTSSR